MARLFNGTTDHCFIDTAISVSLPMTILAWGKSNSDALRQTMAVMGNKAFNGDYMRINMRGNFGGDPAEVSMDQGATARDVIHSTYATGTWHAIIGTATTTTSREIRIDNASLVDAGTVNAPSGYDRYAIGIREHDLLTDPFSGLLGSIAFIQGELSADQKAAFVTGVPAHLLTGVTVLADYRMTEDESTLRDYSGNGLHMAISGATFSTDEPPVNYSGAAFPFLAVDKSFTKTKSVFTNIWEKAKTQTVRIAMFGDSQETSPGGAGDVYIPRLGYEMWRTYGNVPETQVVGGISFGGGSPDNEFLLRGAAAGPGSSATRLAANEILPGISPRAHSTKNKLVNVNGQEFGQLTQLLHDATGVDIGNQIAGIAAFMDPGGTIKARIYAKTNASSGEIQYRARPQNGTSPNYFAAETTGGVSSLTLESVTPAIKSFDTAALNYNGLTYVDVEVHGTVDAKLSDIIGLRYFNESAPAGVAVYDFSVGGHKTTDVLGNHANAGPMLAAFGPWDAVWLHFGANEQGNVPAGTFRANTEALITALRGVSWLNDANLPIIISTDAHKDGLTTTQQDTMRQYPLAVHGLATQDANALALNTYRMTHEAGFTASNSAAWLADAVHLNAFGARSMARLEVDELLGRGNRAPRNRFSGPARRGGRALIAMS